MNIVGIRRAVKALSALEPDEQQMALAWHRGGAGGSTRRRRRRKGSKRAGAVARRARGKGALGKAALLEERERGKRREPKKESRPRLPHGESSDEEADET